MDARYQEKRQRLEQALEKGMVMVHLDARFPGVQVPPKFRDDFRLRLNVSYRFDPPDLSVGEWGVRETLSFGGTRYSVAIPWGAIFAITGHTHSDQAWLFPDAMPPELLEEAAKQFGLSRGEVEKLRSEMRESGAPQPAVRAAPSGPRAALRPVEAAPEPEKPSAGEEPGDGEDAEKKPVRRGHLRVVK